METLNKLDKSWDYVATTCSGLIDNFLVKCAGAFSLFLVHFSFGTVGYKVAVGVVALIIFDTITGVIAAKKTGEELTSTRFFDSVLKLLLFPMIIAASAITEQAIGFTGETLTFTISSYLIVHELLSVIENFGRIGYKLPQDLINSKINNLIDKK